MNKKKLVLLFALVVLATGFIFYNSLQNSVESNRASGIVEKFIEPFIEMIVGRDIPKLSYFVRKGAHLTEFFLLASAVYGVVAEFRKIKKHLFGYGLFYVLAVAVTDEFIQSFSDRTSSVKDVLIDFSGALIGFAVMTLIGLIAAKIKENKLRKGNNNGDQN